ncbi:hypothetical protein TURU_100986 [Turdus rufiventris]|nr:hypothetical protein TURU_100986 [Turdus rufiventris]
MGRQVTDEAAKPHLLKSLAFANANQECKRVISAIPGQPSLAEMVEACSKVGTPQHVTSIVEEQMEKVLWAQSENLEKVLANFQKHNNSPGGQCYKCGSFGHFKRNCPQLTKTGRPPDVCPRCRRGKHLATNCNEELTVFARALRPPLTVPENTPIAKAIALPPHPVERVMTVFDQEDPSLNDHVKIHASWVKHIGRDQPFISCQLTCGDKTITIVGMLNMGADVTVI